MSVDLVVYLRRAAMPGPSDWQRAIEEMGLPAELDTEFDPDTFSGYLPCRFRGADSGFEYYADRLSPAEAVERGAPVGTDLSITLVTHSDLTELACSTIAAGAMARASGGVLVDTESGETIAAADAAGWIAKVLAEIEHS